VLRIVQSNSAKQAANYFDVGLKRGDYYTKETGVWGGLAAERLGLSGEVKRADFVALTENRMPGTKGEPLTLRTNTTRLAPVVDEKTGEYVTDHETGKIKMEEVSNRRAGYDFTFSVPKSLSVAMAFMEPEERAKVEQMVEGCIREVMAKVEGRLETRVRKGGVQENRCTGNIVFAMFPHGETRPVEGIPDPHHHVHVFVCNATYDEVEGAWKAIELGEVKADAPFYQAAFDSLLAGRLMGEGYGIRRTQDHFELASVSRELIEKFSRRTMQIEEEARVNHRKLEAKARALMKQTNMAFEDAFAVAKSQVGAKIRQKKEACIFKTREDLARYWWEQMTPEEQRSVGMQKVRSVAHQNLLDALAAKERTIGHLFEQVSLKRELHIAAELLKWGVGKVGIEEAEAFPLTDERFFKPKEQENKISTHEVWREERVMIKRAFQGKGRYAPLGGQGRWEIQDERVRASQEQTQAIEFLLRSRDLVVAIAGPAGGGKTQFSSEAVKAIQALSGKKVYAFAPSSSAAEELRKVGFTHADTLHKLGTDEILQSQTEGQIVWMDEASFKSVNQMRWMVRFCERHDCRLILSGDTKQHHGVERGDAMRLLAKSGAVEQAALTEIHRQRVPELKETVRELSKGTKQGHEAAFDQLNALGVVEELEDERERAAVIADKHVSALKKGMTSLIVAPTHAECRVIADAVRERMKGEGVLTGDDRDLTRLARKNLTEAQRRDAVSYEPGDLVEFHRKTGVFQSGQKWRVVGRSPAGQVSLSFEGKEATLPLDQARKFTVYAEQRLPVCVGDTVRVTKNLRVGKNRFRNNEFVTVKSVDGGRITFTDGRVMRQGALHLDQGHCVTSHASQGKTVDQVLVSSPVRSFGQVNRAQAYVSLSRARLEMHLFTDSKVALREAVCRPSERLSPYEMFLNSEQRHRTRTTDEVHEHIIRANEELQRACWEEHAALTLTLCPEND
jgi:conjugative relaxase-like TrwC/TraI family protein